MAELLIADLKAISPQTPQTQALIQAVEEDKCFFSADFGAFIGFMLALQQANCPEIAQKFAHRVYHHQDKQYMAENARAISIAEAELAKRVSCPANTLPAATSSSTAAQETSEVIKKISARFPPLETLADDPEKKLQTALGFLKLFDMDFGITENQTDDSETDDDDDDDDD